MTAEGGNALELATLLATMEPRLRPADYCFVAFPKGERVPDGLVALATFEEDEGTTVIVESARAQRLGLEGAGPYRMITLAVRSSLEAVGFLAAVGEALARRSIPVNAVAAYNHDHLFVPAFQAELAMETLEALAAQAHAAD